MSNPWPEIEKLGDKKTSIKLSGDAICKRLESAEGALPDSLFGLMQLTSLEIEDVGLETISEKIGQLTNLKELMLAGNKLQTLPKTIGSLVSVQNLRLARNCLGILPPAMAHMQSLRTLIISNNDLEELPLVIGHLKSLVVLDCSCNKISSLPPLHNLKKMNNLIMAHNQLTELPKWVADLESLKEVNCSHNLLTCLPPELAKCALKVLIINDNPFQDKKLAKLANDSSKMKEVLKTIRGGSKSQKKAGEKDVNASKMEALKPKVDVLRACGSLDVVSQSMARSVRPYMVCCIVRGLNLDSEELFRRFIVMQQEVHDGVGENRNVACLGTHDMDKIQGPYLHYQCAAPDQIRFVPLKYEDEVTASELLKLFEKDKHMQRHLKLIQDAGAFTFLQDGRNEVLSLLPLVNSKYSMCTPSTKDVFIESSSDVNLGGAKLVMDSLLTLMVQEGLVNPGEQVVEQVNVLDEAGGLRVVYPAKGDLADLGMQWS